MLTLTMRALVGVIILVMSTSLRTSINRNKISWFPLHSARPSYQEMLQKAKFSKAAKVPAATHQGIATPREKFSGAISINADADEPVVRREAREELVAVVDASSGFSTLKKAWKPAAEPKTVKEKASFKNKIPFDEGMYEIFKSSIELLNNRFEKRVPLTMEEAEWFESAVEAILEDAEAYGPPDRPVKEG